MDITPRNVFFRVCLKIKIRYSFKSRGSVLFGVRRLNDTVSRKSLSSSQLNFVILADI